MTLVVLGVTGGIAAYRAGEIISLLRDRCRFQVVMTANAQRLVTPATFTALSGRPVLTDLFTDSIDRPVHIEIAAEAALFVVAPATANFLAKYAHGIADDALTTTALTLACPTVLAPAMNTRMWSHPAVRHNVGVLQARGVEIIEPQEGHLACGETGVGRMAEPSTIAQRVRALLDRIAPSAS